MVWNSCLLGICKYHFWKERGLGLIMCSKGTSHFLCMLYQHDSEFLERKSKKYIQIFFINLEVMKSLLQGYILFPYDFKHA